MEKALYTPAATGTGTTGVIDAMRNRYARFRLYRQTIRELNSLGDRALADLGLSRSMIPDLARETAYGK